MVSMCELTLKDDLLQIAQRRRHARDALAELDEVILDELLAETDLEQPRLKVPHIPPVKSDLGDVIAAEQARQMIGDELIRHGLAGRRLQEAAVAPKIIWDSIGYRPLDQSLCWEPESGVDVPFVIAPANQDESRKVRDLGKVETAIDSQARQRPGRLATGFPHRRRDEGVASLDPLVED